MSRRARAGGFAALAVLCAIASASIASGYRDNVDEQLGELRSVVVVTKPIPAGRALDQNVIRHSLRLRDVPVRFLPPDAFTDPVEARGRKPAAPIPAGSYLLASQMRVPGPAPERSENLGPDVEPVSITVTGASALAAAGPARVDVVVAGEPVTGGRARVRVAAARVRLLGIERAAPEDATSTGSDAWNATLALTRRQALGLIEAENFAREVRLIPTG